ncbi:ABC transporter permease [Companilactobacillus zhachilii]|jgi:ABC-2 type transporter.|uniref:ABC transporter permease n=1 Tax=Companilactobacillus zhachilii TaxID=2304606 RepID=UPI0040346F3B
MKTQFTSLAYLQNWKTKLVHFIIIPFVNLLLLVAVNSQYQGGFSWSIAVGTIVLNGGLLSMGSMAALFTMDRTLKIDREMATQRPYSFKYWFDKAMTAIICGVISVLINDIILMILGAPSMLVYRSVLIVIPFAVVGTIFGFVGSIAAWTMINPYFYLNILEPMMIIISGALVNVEKYPDWLRILSSCFPFSQIIEYVESGKGMVARDLLLALLWLIIGIGIYMHKISIISEKYQEMY